MSVTRKSPIVAAKKDANDVLDDILNFGPESQTPPSDDFSERIRQLVKKLQEINRRIDQLSTRL